MISFYFLLFADSLFPQQLKFDWLLYTIWHTGGSIQSSLIKAHSLTLLHPLLTISNRSVYISYQQLYNDILLVCCFTWNKKKIAIEPWKMMCLFSYVAVYISICLSAINICFYSIMKTFLPKNKINPIWNIYL